MQIGNGGTTGQLGSGAVNNDGSLIFNRSDAITIANAIAGTGSLTKEGAATLTLTGANTYTGTTFNNAGLLQVGDGGTTGTLGTGAVVNGGVLAFNRSDALSVSGDISGTGAVTQIGAGTTTLMGTNIFSGGTTITAGTLQLGNGGTTGSIIGDVLNNGVLAFNRSDASTFTGAISGTGTLEHTGAGITALTGTNTYSGGTTISAGTLQIGDGGITGSITGDVIDHGMLAFNRADTITFSDDISGTGAVAQVGAGTTVLTGNNTYAGGTIIQSGTLQIGDGGVAGSIIGNVANAGVLAFNRADSVTFGGAITGTGALHHIGSGTLVLTGSNTYRGGTLIDSGTLQVGAGGTTGSIAGHVTNHGVLAFNRADTVTFGGSISGTGVLRQMGTGTTILTGALSHSGGTIIESGTLQLGAGGVWGGVAGSVTNNGVLTFNHSNTATFAGVIAGIGAVKQVGSGTTVLTGANSYTGGTTIESGTLQIGDGGVSGSIIGNVTNNGALAFNRSDAITFGGTIRGTGRLRQIGRGTTVLTGRNTYTGGTFIESGTLQVGAGGAAGSIVGNVINNGVLAFNRADRITFRGRHQWKRGGDAHRPWHNCADRCEHVSGGTTIKSGTLQVGAGGVSGSINGNVTNQRRACLRSRRCHQIRWRCQRKRIACSDRARARSC